MDDEFTDLRAGMLQEVCELVRYLRDTLGKDALDERVIRAMGCVPRHEFVPHELRSVAYLNRPLPIGFEKTISQPFIVALMTDLLALEPTDRVLEVGTGLGYQAAVLSALVHSVDTVELITELASQAASRLHRLGYDNVSVHVGNGYHGWPARGVFDKIIVTAAPDLIPPPLIRQLKPGGRMVIPAGLPESQQLILVCKDSDDRVTTKEILPVRFSQLDDEDPVIRE